jgi:hypothetical protein
MPSWLSPSKTFGRAHNDASFLFAQGQKQSSPDLYLLANRVLHVLGRELSSRHTSAGDASGDFANACAAHSYGYA